MEIMQELKDIPDLIQRGNPLTGFANVVRAGLDAAASAADSAMEQAVNSVMDGDLEVDLYQVVTDAWNTFRDDVLRSAEVDDSPSVELVDPTVPSEQDVSRAISDLLSESGLLSPATWDRLSKYDNAEGVSQQDLSAAAVDPTNAAYSATLQAWADNFEEFSALAREFSDVISESVDNDRLERVILWLANTVATAADSTADSNAGAASSPAAQALRDSLSPSLLNAVKAQVSVDNLTQLLTKALVGYATSEVVADLAPASLMLSLLVGTASDEDRKSIVTGLALTGMGLRTSLQWAETLSEALYYGFRGEGTPPIAVVSYDGDAFWAIDMGRVAVLVSVEPRPGLDAIVAYQSTLAKKAAVFSKPVVGDVTAKLTGLSGSRDDAKMTKKLAGKMLAVVQAAYMVENREQLLSLAAASPLLDLGGIARALGTETANYLVDKAIESAERAARELNDSSVDEPRPPDAQASPTTVTPAPKSVDDPTGTLRRKTSFSEKVLSDTNAFQRAQASRARRVEGEKGSHSDEYRRLTND